MEIDYKKNTLKKVNIKQTPGGFYRYVNHADRLATVGFASRKNLIKNSDIIRFDDITIAAMQDRYISLYGSKH